LKSIGSLYVDTIKLKHPLTPVFEWGWSQETEEPFRESAVCLVFWVPFINRGYAVGIWGAPVTEEQVYNKIFKPIEKPISNRDFPKPGKKTAPARMDEAVIDGETYKVVSHG